MGSFIARKVTKHVLRESAENKFGLDDPYFEYVTPTDSQGNPSGKPKKQKRPLPPGLTEEEEKILKTVIRRAHRLDTCLNVCGVRVGWAAVFGIIPEVGDLFDSLLALMVYKKCAEARLPSALRLRMLLNITAYFAIGLVPFLGDVVDAFYRPNTRNAALLYKHLEARGISRQELSERALKRPMAR